MRHNVTLLHLASTWYWYCIGPLTLGCQYHSNVVREVTEWKPKNCVFFYNLFKSVLFCSLLFGNGPLTRGVNITVMWSGRSPIEGRPLSTQTCLADPLALPGPALLALLLLINHFFFVPKEIAWTHGHTEFAWHQIIIYMDAKIGTDAQQNLHECAWTHNIIWMDDQIDNVTMVSPGVTRCVLSSAVELASSGSATIRATLSRHSS